MHYRGIASFHAALRYTDYDGLLQYYDAPLVIQIIMHYWLYRLLYSMYTIAISKILWPAVGSILVSTTSREIRLVCLVALSIVQYIYCDIADMFRLSCIIIQKYNLEKNTRSAKYKRNPQKV
jgi:hypothetical protein